MKFLKPDLDIDYLMEIDIGYWYDKGIRCVLIDLDNTISLWRRTALTDDAAAFIDMAKEKGLAVVLFSNAREERVKEAAWNAGLAYYALARKPFTFNYKKALAELGYDKSEAMAIGDQVFTDVLGGNLAGCVTVLVSPLSEIEFSATRIMRYAERLIAGRKLRFKRGDA